MAKLSINSKLVLVTTGFLILIGSVFIFHFWEYWKIQNTLGDLGLFDKVMVSIDSLASWLEHQDFQCLI